MMKTRKSLSRRRCLFLLWKWQGEGFRNFVPEMSNQFPEIRYSRRFLIGLLNEVFFHFED